MIDASGLGDIIRKRQWEQWQQEEQVVHGDGLLGPSDTSSSSALWVEINKFMLLNWEIMFVFYNKLELPF